jgi:hypothetical protein
LELVSFWTSQRYDDAIKIEWYIVDGSTDFFEFKLGQSIYTIGHFTFDGRANSPNSHVKILNKDNYYLYILP